MHEIAFVHAHALTRRCFYLDAKSGDTALLVAARYANKDTVKALLTRNVNRKDRDKVRVWCLSSGLCWFDVLGWRHAENVVCYFGAVSKLSEMACRMRFWVLSSFGQGI